MSQTIDHNGYRITINGATGAATFAFTTAQDNLDEAAALRIANALTAAQLPAPMSFEIDKIEGSETISVLDLTTTPPSWT